MFPKKSARDGEKEIITEHENGVCVSDLALKHRMPKSTILTFFKKTEMIKAECGKRTYRDK